jgi:hypothetical protein
MHQRQHPSHLASHPHIAATARSGQNPAKKYPRGYPKTLSIHADYQPVLSRTGGVSVLQSGSIQIQRINDV